MKKITVLIPTRNRIGTLKSTLETVLNQEYENLEIIVSDDQSDDGTFEYIKSIKDSRLRYLKTPELYGMSKHWNFALSHVTGEFLTILGADDGLLPNSLTLLDQLIKAKPYEAYTWKKADYNWPTSLFPNTISVDLDKSFVEIRTNDVFRGISNNKIGYTLFPSPYFGLIKTEILQDIKKTSQYYIKSSIPDVYLGYAVASQLKNYLYIKYPFSINGGSSQSNGQSLKEFKTVKDYKKTLTFPNHKKLPLMPGSFTSEVYEPLLQVKTNFKVNNIKVNSAALFRKCIMEVLSSNRMNPLVLSQYLKEEGHEYLADTFFIADHKVSAIKSHSGPIRNYIYIQKVNELGVNDIVQASNLISKLIGQINFNDKNLNYDIKYRIISYLNQKFPSIFYKHKPL